MTGPEVMGRQERAELLGELNRRLNWVSALGNGLGGALIFVFLVFLFPSTIGEDEVDGILRLNLPVFVAYMAAPRTSNALSGRPGRRSRCAAAPLPPDSPRH